MQELASAPVPEDGLWLMPSDRGRFAGAPQGWLPVSEQLEWISESGEPVSAGAGDLVVSVTGRKVAPLRLPSLSQWRPMQGATLAQIDSALSGLSAAQLRRVLAWLVYQQRESLPENISRAIQRDDPSE